MDLKSEYFDCNVDFMYCRCCFQLFNDFTPRYDFTFDFLSSLRDLFQFQLNFDGYGCSRWICKKCHDIVTNFRKFKIETLEKQAQFSILIAANQQNDIDKIQNLKISSVQVKLELEDQLMVKDERAITDEITIKDELLEELPDTVDFDMPLNCFTDPAPPLKIKKEYKERKAQKTKKETPKKNNRPAYEKNKKPVRCETCGIKFLNIIKHRIKKHGLVYKFKCDKDKNCKFTCFDYKEYANHRRNNHDHNNRNVKSLCPYCAIPVFFVEHHIKNIHLKERNYFCDLCSYASYKKLAMQSHIESKHVEKTKVCNICGWKTNKEKYLLRHISYNHTEQKREKNFLCPDCGRAFVDEVVLKDHMKRIHERILNYACEYPGCLKRFFAKSERKIHMQNIHGERNIICDTCGKTYATVKALQIHQKKHQEFQHVCNYCSSRFIERNILNMHIKRNHTFIKDFKCDQCGKEFFDRRHLNHHIAVSHLGIRYQCQVPGCSSSLSRRDVYMFHLKSNHNLNEDEMQDLKEKCKEFMQQNNLRA